ncbi:MAG TPA: alternate F1F0 ATPase, F1 subunit alpha [bacterium]|nr:alternate F1F0 ATPase, F1 subunit alpha [bacterium]
MNRTRSVPGCDQDTLDSTFRVMADTIARHAAVLHPEELGTVTYVGRDIARVSGLPGVQAEELVCCAGGIMGLALSLEPDHIGVVLLDPGEQLQVGSDVRRTGRVLDVPVGTALLGRVVDALGRPRDGKGELRCPERRPADGPAPPIMDRLPVTTPLQTGIQVIDALIPIGRGQRELILGDRQTGKTAIALDTIINQRDTGVLAVYCAIGRKGADIARVVATLTEHGVMGNCIIVASTGEDPPGLQYAAPYAATAMAEYFMARGHDVLIVYDDLTCHARAYRELSLLLRRPPGREAFPGDIFYIHSRLLERATHLRPERGGGSLTALPIAETEAQDIAAYIPTNLISITDGQLCLSPVLFNRGMLPAIDVGKSVSRVGGKAQLPAYRAVAGELRLAYAQFEELEVFSRFATRLDPATRRTLERGWRVREVLKQDQHQPLTVIEQVAILLALTTGMLDCVPVEAIGAAAAALRRSLAGDTAGLAARLNGGEPLTGDLRQSLLTTLTAAAAEYAGASAHAGV